MATFNNEQDEETREEDELRSAPSQWNRPLLLAALGLALMLGGYAATTYTPWTLRQTEQERRLAELRQLAAQRQADGMDDALSERLNRVAPPSRNPPYLLAGRLAIYGGLFLFVMAGVLMYRSSPPSRKDADELE